MPSSAPANALPPDLQKQIDSYIAAEFARLQAENAPPSDKPPTPAEMARGLIVAALAAEKADKPHPSGDARTFEAIIAALVVIVDAVFPDKADGESADASSENVSE